MDIREWIARKISPDLARNADCACHLRQQISESTQWLAGFPLIFKTLQRIQRQDDRYFRAWSSDRTPGFMLAEPMDRFRETLIK